MTPQLHPSEIRAPAPEKRAGRKRLRALQIGVAAAAVAASFAAAAYVVTQLPEEPAPKVTFNRIEDWPEIKNGVPALAPPKPAPADPAAAVAPPPMPERAPPAAAPPQPAFCGAPARGGGGHRICPARRAGRSRTRKRGAPLPGSGTAADRGERARRPGCGRARNDARARSRSRSAGRERSCGIRAGFAGCRGGDRATRGAAGREEPRQSSADPCREPASDAARQDLAPAKTAKAKPRQAKVASAPPTEAPPAAPASPPAPPPEDDRVHVLGLSLPNLLPSGRKIREAVQSLGL